MRIGMRNDSVDNILNDMILARCERIMDEKVIIHPQYSQYAEEISKTSAQLCNLLGQDHAKLYYVLESANGMALNTAIQIIYQQWLRDGIQLVGALGMK